MRKLDLSKILILFLLLSTFLVKAQTIEKSQLIGTWKVVDGNTTSNELPPDVSKMMDMLIDGFKGSEWVFNENNIFRIKFKQSQSPVVEEMKFLDNKLWKLDGAAKQVRIGTKEDKYSHLILSLKHVDSGVKVYFSDTPIYLILNKE